MPSKNNNYNALERTLARLLGRLPVVKKFAKAVYSRVVYLRSKKNYQCKSISNAVSFSLHSQSSFFGYYDKSPSNRSGLVLAHTTTRATSNLPSQREHIELVIFDKNQQSRLRIPVDAYNWQQGCRAQWLTDDLFIFNDYDSGRNSYISNVYSVVSQQLVKSFDYPVQDAYQKDYFISLNYQRLMTLRPDYGYRHLPNLSIEKLAELNDDGLWRVDYQTGKSKLLISIADACKIQPLSEFEQATHKFNHVMISPNGKHFIFMHRYFLGGRRFDRLLLADANTGELRLLNDYGMVSHCFWANEETILGYMRGPGSKDGYWLIDINTRDFQPLAHEKLDAYGDGHPHVYGDWFITDTYPDKARMQRLLLCNWKTGEMRELGEFFHGFDFSGESRCDLHPRFSADGKAVFFDSVFTGQRQLYRMELPE